MAKKIFSSLLGGLIILLVLAFGFMVVWSNQSYLTPAITWLLCGCIVTLALFVLYVVIVRIVDAVKRRGFEEEAYNEEHIENILSGERARKKYREKSAESRRQRQVTTEQRKEEKRTLEEERAIRKQEEFEARKAAEREAAEQKAEEAFQKKRAADEEKINRMVEARKDAIRRAAALEDEEEQSVALAEADALGRAIQEMRKRIEDEDLERGEEQQERAKRLAREQEEIERRKAAALESARKQAEATEVARRRAAATAAQTQSFAPIRDIANMPEFNSQIIEKAVKATDRSAEEQRVRPAHVTAAENSVWEKMNSPQTAKPVLGAENAGQAKNTSWTYTPAKLPNAWKTDANRKTIPGDMASVSHTMSQATRQPGKEPFKEGAEPVSGAKPAGRQAHAATAARAERPASSLAAKAEKSGHIRGAAKGQTGILNLAEEAKPAEKPAEAAKAPANGADPAATAGQKKRGRPPKPKTEEEQNAPKRPRGRPPKPKTEEELNAPKRPRGRPPKPKTEEELNAPKRPRGRPPKVQE